MAQSKYLSGIYKGQRYDRAAIRRAEIFDDFLVFDISDGCKFIARRGERALSIGQNGLYDIMPYDRVGDVRDYLLSYAHAPMFVSTELGVALVLPALVPSSAFGVMLFARMGADKLCRFFEKRGIDAVFSEGLTRELLIGKGRLSSSEQADCERLWELVCDALYCSEDEQNRLGDVTDLIEQTVYAASAYVGCAVYVSCQSPAINLGGLDLPLLKAFLLVCLASTAQVSRRSQATVSIEQNEYGISVMVSIEMKKGCVIHPSTALAVRGIADRNRMIVELLPDESITHLRLCPVRHDWSLMNIKTPSAAQASAQG